MKIHANLIQFCRPGVQGKFFPLLFKRQFLAIFTIFVPYWTSNCYVIIEYTENLIKPSYSSLKTVLNRVPALVPKFKIDQNMLFLISSRAFRPTRGIVIQMSVCMVYVWCMYGVCMVYVWCHKICTQAKFKNGRSYQHNFFLTGWYG